MKHILTVMVNKLSPIICPNGFNMFGEVSGCIFDKGSNDGRNLSFVFEKKRPGTSTEIIHNREEVMTAI